MTDREFCERLVEEARRYGWQGDYIEVERFVRAVHDKLGVPEPKSMSPYQD